MIKTETQVRVELNHLILLAKEKQQTAHFLTYLLGWVHETFPHLSII
jgi:hypothetical protein